MNELHPGHALGIFLQARLGSTRLPMKVLMPLSGLPEIEHAMRALRRIPAEVHALLTDDDSFEALHPLARECGFLTFCGPDKDVLGRFALAARHYGVNRIMRATGDNPLVSRELAEELLVIHRREQADFSGFVGLPIGTGVEIVETHSLLTASEESRDPYEREHVNPFLYRRPERFKVLHPAVAARYSLPEASVTLDTEEDYRFLTCLFGELYSGEPIETGRLVEWLGTHDRREVLNGSGARDALHTLR